MERVKAEAEDQEAEDALKRLLEALEMKCDASERALLLHAFMPADLRNAVLTASASSLLVAGNAQASLCAVRQLL